MNRIILNTVVAGVLALAVAAPAGADLVSCQKTLVKQLARFKKVHLGKNLKCLDLENRGSISGPCPDLVAAAKIGIAETKATTKIATACTMADLTALGFSSDCHLEAGVSGVEASCAALPVTTPTEQAQCLLCWKSAELSEMIATLFASHALEVCGGDLSDASTVCSDLDCTTPLPDQRDLGDNAENDCQRAIGKAGIKYLVKREKILEKCALVGGTQASCLGDPVLQLKLAKAVNSKDARIMKGCGSRDPEPSPPFCCKTMGNMCVAAADRTDCEMNQGGTPQEGKFCNAGSCDPSPGNKKITWWGYCPESAVCPGTALATLDDLKSCVQSTADSIVDELLCFQLPSNGGADWPCPID